MALEIQVRSVASTPECIDCASDKIRGAPFFGRDVSLECRIAGRLDEAETLNGQHSALEDARVRRQCLCACVSARIRERHPSNEGDVRLDDG